MLAGGERSWIFANLQLYTKQYLLVGYHCRIQFIVQGALCARTTILIIGGAHRLGSAKALKPWHREELCLGVQEEQRVGPKD